MDLILFGIQGSGKGTQGEFIAKEYGLKIFETGRELRAISQVDNMLGEKVKTIIDAGHLVPTEVVMEIIENFVNQLKPGEKAIFDGIPRSPEQAEAFNALMQKLGRDFRGLYIKISEEEALRRLTTRRMCKKCKSVYPVFYVENVCKKCGGELITRADDNISSIKNRLAAYRAETIPVIKEYQEKDLLTEVNGEQSIEDVTAESLEKLKPVYG